MRLVDAAGGAPLATSVAPRFVGPKTIVLTADKAKMLARVRAMYAAPVSAITRSTSASGVVQLVVPEELGASPEATHTVALVPGGEVSLDLVVAP